VIGKTDQPEKPKGTPRYIVSYSALMTILLAFFIMLNAFAEVREYGLIGAGLGEFVRSFRSLGLPGFLTRGTHPARLSATAPKYLTPSMLEESSDAEPYDGRALEESEKRVRNAIVRLVEKGDEVVIPLPVEFVPGTSDLKRRSIRHLERAARVLRATSSEVSVEVSLGRPPTSRAGRGAVWRLSGARALEIVRHLRFRGGLAPQRLRAVGRGRTPALSRRPGNDADSVDAGPGRAPSQDGIDRVNIVLRPLHAKRRLGRARDRGRVYVYESATHTLMKAAAVGKKPR